jgi:nitroimidazol reductase NimA-like FMN-containing flavoprotein (pyridoxamine 5'-phosphate oxidase superfamily)
MSDAPVVHQLSRSECLELLSTVPVGRVGVSIGALPAVLPVNFCVTDEAVIFRSTSGAKLSAAVAGTVVAFEADHYDEAGRTGWSVLVQGRAEEITDPAGLARAEQLPLESWALDGAADHVIAVELAMISGRRITRSSA